MSRNIAVFDIGKIGEGFINVSADSEDNDGKNSFSVGDEVILRIFSSHEITMAWAMIGNLQYSGVGFFSDSEDIPVIKENIANLRYNSDSSFVGGINITWDGRGEKFTVSGSNIVLSENVIGNLYVDYTLSYTKYILKNVTQTKNVLVVFENSNGDFGYCYVDFSEDADGKMMEVWALIEDDETREPIEGAKLFVEGIFRGTSGKDGIIYLGNMKKRESQYEVRIEAPPDSDYVDSTDDGLSNDGFYLI